MNVVQNPTKIKKSSKVYQFRAGDLEGKIEYLAREKNTNVSQIIKQALNKYIEIEQAKTKTKIDRKSLRGMGKMTNKEQDELISAIKGSFQAKDVDYELFN